jgi:hypothetical protein
LIRKYDGRARAIDCANAAPSPWEGEGGGEGIVAPRFPLTLTLSPMGEREIGRNLLPVFSDRGSMAQAIDCTARIPGCAIEGVADILKQQCEARSTRRRP